MIVNFSFSNFKSIKEEVCLSFEASNNTELEDYYVVQPIPKLRLLKMAAIYGANASGKSNVLEALDFLRRLVLEPADKKTDPINYDRFAFDELSARSNSVFKIEFVVANTRFEYLVKLNPGYIVEESLHYYAPNRALVFSRSTNEETELTKLFLGSKIKIPADERRILEASTLWNATVLGAFLRVNIDFTELKMAVDWFGSVLSKLVSPNTDLLSYVVQSMDTGEIRKDKVIEILKKADFNIQNIGIERLAIEIDDNFRKYLSRLGLSDAERKKILTSEVVESRRVVFEHLITTTEGKRVVKLPYEDQSLGTQRYYQFAGVLDLMIRHPKIAVLDEIESSLHPDLLKHFLLVFLRNSTESQLIFTTHQRDFMRESDMLRNDIFHFTEKGNDGSTELFSFTDFDSSVIRKGSSLYNAYKIGKLGATPELKDAYITAE